MTYRYVFEYSLLRINQVFFFNGRKEKLLKPSALTSFVQISCSLHKSNVPEDRHKSLKQ